MSTIYQERVRIASIGSKSIRSRTPIVFGGLGDGYNEYPGRQRLLHALSKRVPVVFLKHSRSSGLLPVCTEVAENCFEMTNVYRLTLNRWGRRLSAVTGGFDGRLLRASLRQAGFDAPIFWLSVPNLWMLRGMDRARTLYDCVDPCFLPERQQEFDRDESEIARKVALVFCTAGVLFEKHSRVQPATHLLPNACASDSLVAPEQSSLPLPALLRGRPSPFIGYMGTVDWRFDADLVFEAARKNSELTFVIVGRVNEDQKERMMALKSLSNVVFTGSVSDQEGQAYTQAFAVGIIPFIPGVMNDAINPVKMYMYLAAGKPVVASDIRECRALPEYVACASTGSEFAAAVQAAVAHDSPMKRDQRIAFASVNRWEDRADSAYVLMERAGMFGGR